MKDMKVYKKEACCNIYVGSILEHVASVIFYQRTDKVILRGKF